MKVLKQAIAILLLIVGLPVTALATLDLLNSHRSEEEKENATAALVLIGLLPTGVGGTILWGLYDNAQRQKRDRLRSSFFKLVKAGKGRISAFDFSLETGLSANESRLYLDERARNFNATFHVDEDGGIFYVFQLGYADPQLLLSDATDDKANNKADASEGQSSEGQLSEEHLSEEQSSKEQSSKESSFKKKPEDAPQNDKPAEGQHDGQPPHPLTYSVLLHTFPQDKEDEVLRVLRELMKADANAIREGLGEPLMPVQVGATLAIALDYRQRLEAVGAKVLIVLEY